MIRTVQDGVVVKIKMPIVVLDLVIPEESPIISVIVEVDPGEDLMITVEVIMMVLVVVTELVLANLNGVVILVGVTDQMKMIGQNHFHQVNA